MTPGDKELLLKDLCARLPHGIKFPMMCWDEETGETVRPVTLYSINKDGYCHASEDDYSPYIDDIRPYLFPLSSMTEEQYKEIWDCMSTDSKETLERANSGQKCANPYSNVADYYNVHHFDYRGLIPKGLAIDATGLNIY